MTAPIIRNTAQPPVTVRVFTQRLSSTPRGARLARRLTLNQLHSWGIPYGTDVSDAVGAIVAELAANAVTHGRVPGRDFALRLSLYPDRVRVEVADTRSGPPRPPAPGAVRPPQPFDEHGRGFVLVDALADRWEVLDGEPPGKTVRAEIDLRRPGHGRCCANH
jgi:anti-sigma regulatory factor (Ser/Thr protein kinase)